MSIIQYVSIDQIQEQLSLSRDSVERLIKRGEIEAVKFGKSVRVSVESIEKYIQAHMMSKTAGEEA